MQNGSNDKIKSLNLGLTWHSNCWNDANESILIIMAKLGIEVYCGPSNPKMGDAYYDTIKDCAFIYDGTNWMEAF